MSKDSKVLKKEDKPPKDNPITKTGKKKGEKNLSILVEEVNSIILMVTVQSEITKNLFKVTISKAFYLSRIQNLVLRQLKLNAKELKIEDYDINKLTKVISEYIKDNLSFLNENSMIEEKKIYFEYDEFKFVGDYKRVCTEISSKKSELKNIEKKMNKIKFKIQEINDEQEEIEKEFEKKEVDEHREKKVQEILEKFSEASPATPTSPVMRRKTSLNRFYPPLVVCSPEVKLDRPSKTEQEKKDVISLEQIVQNQLKLFKEGSDKKKKINK